MSTEEDPDAASDRDATDSDADATGADRDLPDGVSLPDDLDAVQDALLSWYREDHRSFPWRETTDPYAILVSEVMSQQTQLSRVETAWHEFLERWPDAAALADADRADVVAFWTDHSLGYNNRAKYLHEAARQVTDGEAGGDDLAAGEFPTDPDGLQDLHGVGPYTANAVASFAFNEGDAVVDTNVKRVVYRAFDVPDDDAAFEAAAAELMPAGESRDWNNGIMELGGVACEKTPSCDEAGCPWRQWCHAYRTGDFTAPDVPTQPPYEGSRRQKRARVLSALSEHGSQALDELGPRVRVDYAPEGDGDGSREWLRGLVEDLEADELVTLGENGTVELRR
ncbi:A/G-specific adenine glycosylase [Salinarchaeum sp. Harcht-Bsk1]|uniref:A/G-specific adenine glycosylase n=1 Tax=Salinarchaeum sp. Harcht-Bsk1 TaxID=1333523 RepID=UPI0003424392|nr:A/G-specific adenine glycosylase [Salinarchaeum sp. Harcht-Bsk1]AGN01652.1 A/G-specific adenine glycosylase [Salinarchaeum sp. Harcht-Bsk1]